MLVPALVLVAVALGVGVVGALARAHRLPRNRLVGVRTAWTMSRVDAFRRANRVAAPAFLAAGAVGVVAGAAAAFAATTAAALVLLAVGVLGLLGLIAVAGTLGGRYAEADRAETRAAEQTSAGPCTLSDPPAGAEGSAVAQRCPDTSSCGGSCALCPRTTSSAPGSAPG